MNLKDIIQRCHQRHKKPLRQRKTRVTPALYKALPYNFTAYCAWRYPVNLYRLEQANISFMPMRRVPGYDHGLSGFEEERFLKRQGRKDWTAGLFSFKVFVQFIGKVGNRNSLLPRICADRKSIVASKNNETHFERRARRPRPYEQSSVKGKVSD